MASLYYNDTYYFQMYSYALGCARDNFPTFYSSRIDGALLPFDAYYCRENEVLSYYLN